MNQMERIARDSDAEFSRLTGIIFDLVKGLDKIAAMDPKGIRADDLGRAARIAAETLLTFSDVSISEDSNG